MSFTRSEIPEDSPVWDIIIVTSSLVIGFLIVVTLYHGYESVYPHLIDIPIIFYAYRYPRRGIWFAALASALYLVSYVIILSPVSMSIYQAFGRVLIFLIVGATVSYLSYRLCNSENTYRNLFDNLSNAAFTIKIDNEGTLGQFMDVNDMMCATVGYTRDEFLSMNLADIVPDAYTQWLYSRLEGASINK